MTARSHLSFPEFLIAILIAQVGIVSVRLLRVLQGGNPYLKSNFPEHILYDCLFLVS